MESLAQTSRILLNGSVIQEPEIAFSRTSPPEVFLHKGVLKICSNLQEKTLAEA